MFAFHLFIFGNLVKVKLISVDQVSLKRADIKGKAKTQRVINRVRNNIKLPLQNVLYFYWKTMQIRFSL